MSLFVAPSLRAEAEVSPKQLSLYCDLRSIFCCGDQHAAPTQEAMDPHFLASVLTVQHLNYFQLVVVVVVVMVHGEVGVELKELMWKHHFCCSLQGMNSEECLWL